MTSISIEPIHVFEPEVRPISYTNHIFGGLILVGIQTVDPEIIGHIIALVGLMGTAACVYKMMRAQQLRNALDCLYWQRMRVAGQGFTISAMTVPLLLPHLTTADFLLRRTAVPLK